MDMPLEKNHSILGPLTLCHTLPGGFDTAAVIRCRETLGSELLYSVCPDKYIHVLFIIMPRFMNVYRMYSEV